MGRRLARAVDPVGVAEAAYDLGRDTIGWLNGLAHTLEPRFGRDFPVLSILAIRPGEHEPGSPPVLIEASSPGADSPEVRAGQEGLRRISEEDGVAGTLAAINSFVSSVSEVAKVRPKWGPIFADAARSFDLRARDFVGLTVQSSGAMLSVGAYVQAQSTPTPRERASLWPLRGHLEAALRLRQRLGWVPIPEQTPVEQLCESPYVEAVLSCKGEVLEGKGQGLARRKALAQSARQFVETRQRHSRTQGEDGRELWAALVEGRWSLVERADSDGKQFIVAYRNGTEAPDPRALSAGERRTLALFLAGHNNRQIADGLGLSQPSVSQRLHRVAQKLGARSPTELLCLGRKFQGKSVIALDLGLTGDLKAIALDEPDGTAKLGLSECENEVIQLVMAGLSRAEIASRRGVALQTVNNQLASAYRRLGVETRQELVDRVHDLRGAS